MAKKKIESSIEEKYTSLSELDHILQRSGMYIGSIKNEEDQMFLYSSDDAKMQLRDVEYAPGLLKLIDEVISNSCDEYRRDDNKGLNKIEVTIYKSGRVEVKDNGGIPVVMHKDAGCYVPEFIFGQLRTSSNYNDAIERSGLGTNGLGSKCANIFSTNFSVYTADGKKSYKRSWSNNMRVLNDDLEINDTDEHFTIISFDVDFKQFDCGKEFTSDFIDIIEKRCIDAAAANLGINVVFTYKEGKKNIRKNNWHFKKFEHYIELYSDYVDIEDVIKMSDNMKSVWVFPDSNINIGFVNGGLCSKGTHIKVIRNEINSAIVEHIKTKHKLNLTPRNIDDKYSIFCTYTVANPTYNSQTKSELTLPVERFSLAENFEFKIPASFIKETIKSDLTNVVLDWYKQKQEAEDQKTIRKLNKQAKQKVRNSEKFIDANSKKREERELWIFEGASAAAGFRSARNPQTQAGYLLRGVILSCYSESPTKIMANKELSDIINILGLQWGEKNDITKLNFSKIVIATDADFDGNKISALLLLFFNRFPELFEAGIIYKSISPIVIATKGNTIKKYYTMEDFRKDEPNLLGFKMLYYKGLGSQNLTQYKEMLQTPNLHQFTKDDLADSNFKLWFGKTEAKSRKSVLKSEV